MAARFENFGLSDLVARGEDAFRLCSLAMAEGQRVRGWRGDYYRLYVGDAVVSVRTMPDPATGEELLLGMDTHAVSHCVWEFEPAMCPRLVEGERPPLCGEDDPAVYRCDPLQRWVERTESRRTGEYSGEVTTIPISVVNADVLTWVGREPVRLNMAAFPRWVEYFTDEGAYAATQKKKPPFENLVLEEGGLYEAGQWAGVDAWDAAHNGGAPRRGPDCPALEPDAVLLRGVVKDAHVGETYLGMEPLTKFLSVTVATRFGDVELCHPFDMVAEDQKDNVRAGAIVSALCTLSGDAAIGEYAAGAVYSEEHALELLTYFLRNGGVQRLRGALRSDCAVTFMDNRQEGLDNALALLDAVGEQLHEAELWSVTPGTVTGVEHTGAEPLYWRSGKRCLLIGDGRPDSYAFLCMVDADSLGRVREISITNDGRVDFEPDWRNTGEDLEHTRDRLRHGFEVLLYWAEEEKKLIRSREELASLPELPAFIARAEGALEGIPGDLEERLAALAADPESDRELTDTLHDLFHRLFRRAGGAEEDGWTLYAYWSNAPMVLWEGYDRYRDQLADQLVLLQCLGHLDGKK